MNVKNQWCVITGASSGIGESFARELAKRGANLIIVARRKDRLETLKLQLEAQYHNKVECFAVDISDLKACDELFAFATKDGRKVQMLINNAGRGHYGPFLDYDFDEYYKTIQLNIISLTKLTHLFTAHMRAHGLPSHIANVASIAGHMTVPQFGVYCGSKKYVRDLTETLNYEFRKSNIHFTCISPGGTWTEFMDNSGQKVKKTANATMMTSEQVAQIGLQAMHGRKHTIITGWMNWMICQISRFVPTKLFLHLAHHSFSLGVEYVDKKGKTKETATTTVS